MRGQGSRTAGGKRTLMAHGGMTTLADSEWRRIAGMRVVMTWPQAGYAAPPVTPVSLRARLAGLAGALLIMTGIAAVVVALAAQVHAPQPSLAAAGTLGPSGRGPSLHRSVPVAVDIPAIGVHTSLLRLGISPGGTIAVPALPAQAARAAWYRYSATPGQIGTSVIEGHVDSYQGPAVFFRLGALMPGDRISVRLADGVTAVFRVTGVRLYSKDRFPAGRVYGASRYAALHLITCGGDFDEATGHYLGSTVVFASLVTSRQPARAAR
jgi:Sortase domain